MQNFIIRITQENTKPAENQKVGCFIMAADLSAEFIQKFSLIAHQNDKLVLAEGEKAPDLCQQKLVDGIIVDTTKAENPKAFIKAIRAKLPKKSIIGALCRNRRHEAMLVSEGEPDFIIFKVWKDGFAENAELIKWYNDLFLIQNAVKIEEECNFKQLPADFVILDDTEYTIFVAK